MFYASFQSFHIVKGNKIHLTSLPHLCKKHSLLSFTVNVVQNMCISVDGYLQCHVGIKVRGAVCRRLDLSSPLKLERRGAKRHNALAIWRLMLSAVTGAPLTVDTDTWGNTHNTLCTQAVGGHDRSGFSQQQLRRIEKYCSFMFIL